MSVLRSPSQYVKAIVALVVSVVGALVTAGLLSGKAAIVAGAVITGLTAFGTVFAAPNQPANPLPVKPKPLTVTPERIDPSV